ncbi:iron uptake system protein EfeO [Actinocatenispora rupis]|uniref:Iron uptake system protein EfeO n=1 Tax=Actinocatenispora rupis TaxID=519421 RepID=A0A8J3NB75_9ACTN|nr:iron uptake system protein EfeO [Actinocatenispora rupis]GID13084.1 iron uptake system protein EfeO [Actinocatenispora rupis]
MRRTLTAAAVPAGLLAVGLLATGCQQSGKADPKGANRVSVTLTDDGCRPSPAKVGAGPVTFTITNKDSAKVREAELLRNGVIVGEKENLTPGLSGTFSLNLKAGKYQMYCPNAKTEKTDFTVTGTAADSTQDPAVRKALSAATTGYHDYVVSEVDLLLPATKKFTDAVRAGDVAKAKTLYAAARYHYETIEPVAESFGDLDPDVDARANDVTDPKSWTGFHRIEKALWQDRSLAGMATVANKLDADLLRLKALVAKQKYQPAQLANGATELLNEVASSKITGEEDRYSHTDLTDFEANVTGGRKAFDLLKPALDKTDPALASKVDEAYDGVFAALKPHAGTYSGTTFVDYSTVGEAQRRTLTQKVDALAEPLSQVAAKVTG